LLNRPATSAKGTPDDPESGVADQSAVPAREAEPTSERRRERLHVFLGAAPGVGKTFAMLSEGVAPGGGWRGGPASRCDQTHDRPELVSQLGGLEVLPRREVSHRGISVHEMDLDTLLGRHPTVVPVDELVHTNAPGCRHEKRWQDMEELLDAGIDVLTNLNSVQDRHGPATSSKAQCGYLGRPSVNNTRRSGRRIVTTAVANRLTVVARARNRRYWVPSGVRVHDLYGRDVNLHVFATGASHTWARTGSPSCGGNHDNRHKIRRAASAAEANAAVPVGSACLAADGGWATRALAVQDFGIFPFRRMAAPARRASTR